MPKESGNSKKDKKAQSGPPYVGVPYTDVLKPSEYVVCYIYNLLTDEKIEFLTLPESINETYSADWNVGSEVMGRSAPFASFSSNGARTVSYSVTLDRNVLGKKKFHDTVNRCRRLVYPKYQKGSGIVDPPYCYVRFGGMVKMYAVIDSVGVAWSGVFLDDEAGENVFSQAEIDFSFTEIRIAGQPLPRANALWYERIDYTDFRNGKGVG